MAPIQSSLETDEPGMGGFSYKELMQSPEGKYIDYFNVQFYSDFSLNSYQKIVSNGYSPEMIVMGAMAGEKRDDEIVKCVKKYGWHRVNKAFLECAGLMQRHERMPMPSLNDEEFSDLVNIYNDLKIKIIEKNLL